MSAEPRLIVKDIALYEREVPFRKPFRFGAVTVEGASEAFIRVEIELENGRMAHGAAAELMVPKWFDKNPALSVADTETELRRSLHTARKLYLAQREPLTAFSLHAACIGEQMAACAAQDIPPLAASFGPAEMDKAVINALLRAQNTDVFSGLAANIAGLDCRLTPGLTNDAVAVFLSSRSPSGKVALRHTVGMLDPLTGPDGLGEIVLATGCRYLKIKLSGEPDPDLARLAAIDAVLRRLDIDYRATIDANEQYADFAALTALCGALGRDRALSSLRERLVYIEQPLPRETALSTPLNALAERFAFIIDESDADYGAFPQAKRLGYRGVSSKACKGIYKSLLNGARAAAWNAESGVQDYFISAEDLTCQAGLALQQDTALVAFHGIAHAERNGHHYGTGLENASEAEQAAFQVAHPDLYERTGGKTKLRIEGGAISTRSLACPGFASRAEPDWPSLKPLAGEAAAR